MVHLTGKLSEEANRVAWLLPLGAKSDHPYTLHEQEAEHNIATVRCLSVVWSVCITLVRFGDIAGIMCTVSAGMTTTSKQLQEW